MSLRYASAGDAYGPWFQRYPGRTMATGLVLLVAIAALRVILGADASIGVSTLFILPIGLFALAWGRALGMVTGLTALGFVWLWVAVEDVDLTWVGWLSRVLPLLMVGYLLGDASERLHQAEARRLRAEARALRQQQAVEINDSLVQGMAAAKWSFEAGRTERGLEVLEETISHGQQLVSQLLREGDLADGLAGVGKTSRQRLS